MANGQEHRPFQFFQRVPTFLVGFCLLAAGGAVLFRPNWFDWLTPEQRQSVSDAFLVAGLLTLLVDPFIKGRLYKEVSAGTFQYLLGFAQPPQIQEALRKLAFETKVYAHDLRMDCKIEREDQSHARLRIRFSVRIENPTSELVEHEPLLAFEEAERASVEGITITMNNETRVFPGNLKPDANHILTHRTDRIILDPRGSMFVQYSYSLVLPNNFFHTHNFGTRTIDVTLSVAAPGFEVSSDLGGTSPMWQHQGLYMIGDHFTIRWKPAA